MKPEIYKDEGYKLMGRRLRFNIPIEMISVN